MADSTLTTAECIFLEELQRRGVRFVVVGMSGALIHVGRADTAKRFGIAVRIVRPSKFVLCDAS